MVAVLGLDVAPKSTINGYYVRIRVGCDELIFLDLYPSSVSIRSHCHLSKPTVISML